MTTSNSKEDIVDLCLATELDAKLLKVLKDNFTVSEYTAIPSILIARAISMFYNSGYTLEWVRKYTNTVIDELIKKHNQLKQGAEIAKKKAN